MLAESNQYGGLIPFGSVGIRGNFEESLVLYLHRNRQAYSSVSFKGRDRFSPKCLLLFTELLVSPTETSKSRYR